MTKTININDLSLGKLRDFIKKSQLQPTTPEDSQELKRIKRLVKLSMDEEAE
jgi:hypothetical protein